MLIAVKNSNTQITSLFRLRKGENDMKKAFLTTFALLLTIILCAGCSSNNSQGSDTPSGQSSGETSAPGRSQEPASSPAIETPSSEASGLPYKIGVFMRYNDSTGAQMRAVMTKQFDDLNNAGGIDGHAVDVVFYDTEGNAETAVNEFNRMVSEDKVLLIIGPTTSTNALAVIDLAAQSKIPVITPQSTNTSITKDYANEWFFRNSVADCYQSYSLCDYICQDLGMKKIAFIHSTDSQGQGQFDDFAGYMKENYDLDIYLEEMFNEGDIDFKSQLLNIKNSDAEILVIAGHEAEIGLITSQRLEVGIPADMPFAGYNAMTSSDYSSVAGASCEGVIIASPWSATASDDGSKKFLADYAEQLTAPDANSALAYDCVNTVTHALTGLELGLTDDTLESDRLAIRDALSNIRGLSNLTGTVNYGPGATQQDKDAKTSCAIWQMQADYTYTLLKAAK